MPRRVGTCVRGRVKRISIAANIATTPPNLLGIDRRIAYAQRKYHSGLICAGVDRGFAGIKFSGSPRALGKKSTKNESEARNRMNPTMSLDE